MSTMTFLGRTTREAMALAKTRFGADVEIVESRQTDDGVELTAIVHGVPLQRRHLQPQVAAGLKAAPARESTRPQAMSTVSFESYVRERQEQRPARGSAVRGGGARAAATVRTPAASLSATLASSWRRLPRGPVRRRGGGTRQTQPATEAQTELMDELKSIKRFIAGQLETVRWFDTARRRPSQMRLLRLLLSRQFSPVLSKSLCDLLPMDFSDSQADHWLEQTLVRTLGSFDGSGGPVAGSRRRDAVRPGRRVRTDRADRVSARRRPLRRSLRVTRCGTVPATSR